MSFSSSLLPEHRSLGIWRWRVWGGFKKLFVRPSDGFGALSKHSTESKRYSPPLNPPLEMNYICSNWKLFFFPPFFLLFLWRTMSLSVLVPFLLGVFDYFSPPFPPLIPCFLFCVWILQDPADSRALARPHLHRRRVFQRGANRLWQRPKVSNTTAHTTRWGAPLLNGARE